MIYIGLLDCNNFFVSCERLFRPDLQNRPTVVLSSNDGCVVARSQEVKDLGIPMGVPHFKVRQDFGKANVAIFSSNFQLYRDVSRRVMEVLKQEVGAVEQYSIDEAFFKIDTRAEDVESTLKEIKATIERKVGMPVSIGVAKTKTIAKCASKKEKRGSGICFLADDVWKAYTKEVAIDEIWGIGGKTAAKCHSHNIKTVADFLSVDRSQIENLFGVAGVRLLSELNEISVSKLEVTTDLQHSIMSTRSFSKTTTKIAVLEDSVAYHISHAVEELRSEGALAQSLRVLIKPSRHSDWSLRGGTLEVILPEPTDDTRVFLKEARHLVEQLFEKDVPYKKAGIILSLITDKSSRSESLFAEVGANSRADKLMETLDGLNTRFGKNTVTLGRLNKGKEWQTSSKFVSPQYTTAWSDIASVKT